jgi:DNA polymerase delta subunit 1
MITTLQKGTSIDRKRLAIYCLKDALLALHLMSKLSSIVTFIELARVSRVPIEFLLSHEQQIGVFSLILNECKGRNMIVPALKVGNGETYQGAHVFEPKKG